jgi:hypothetical protein
MVMPASPGDESGLVSADYQLGPIRGAELGHGPADVSARRGRDHVELLGDLVVGQAPRYQGHDLVFIDATALVAAFA